MGTVFKEILEWVYCIIIAVVVTLLIRYFIGTPTVVKQPSMYDTLEEGQRLWLNRWVRTTNGEYRRGDIVTFEAPSVSVESLADVDSSNPVAIYDNKISGVFNKFTYYVLEFTKTSYIKRIIAMEGDHLQIEDGEVRINNALLDEPYLDKDTVTESDIYTDIVVPSGYVFVMGDNREHSTDSRVFGCIPIDRIESRVAFRFWPFDKFGEVD